MSPGEIPDQTEIASPGSPGDLDIAELALDGADNKSAVALAAEMLQIDEVVPADRLGFVDDGRAAEQFGLSRIPELAPSREQSQLPPANWDPDRISRKVSEPDASAYVTTTLGAGPAAAGAAKLDRQGSQMPPSQTPTPVAFEFTAEKCGATLVNAVLRYQLKVRSEAIETISDLTIYGDMVEAGGVSSARELLPVDQADMPLIGHVQWLEPGAEAVLSGEIRVPLAAMKPIEANGRLIIVPVARFAAVGDRFAPHIRAYIIGQESVPPTTKLGPFRLDLGPRNFKSVGQRPLEIA